MRAIGVCVTASDVPRPRGENSSRNCLAQITATRPSHPLRLEAQFGLADDRRVESANDSIAFKNVGFDYRVNA